MRDEKKKFALLQLQKKFLFAISDFFSFLFSIKLTVTLKITQLWSHQFSPSKLSSLYSTFNNLAIVRCTNLSVFCRCSHPYSIQMQLQINPPSFEIPCCFYPFVFFQGLRETSCWRSALALTLIASTPFACLLPFGKGLFHKKFYFKIRLVSRNSLR